MVLRLSSAPSEKSFPGARGGHARRDAAPIAPDELVATPPLAASETRPPHDQVPVVVLGSGVTALGVIRSLGRKGIPCHALLTDPDPCVRSSRWYRPLPDHAAIEQLVRDDPRGPSAAVLEELLERLPFERAVLMPCSDVWVAAVCELPPAIAERMPACLASAESLACLLDKGRFAAVLQEEGLPHPRTVCLDGDDALANAPDELLESCFIKPRNSHAFRQHFDVKGFHFRDRGQAVAKLRAIHEAGLDVMLQDYIPGPASSHYFVDGFVDRHGTVSAYFARRRLRMFPEDFGNSTYMVSVPVEEVAGAIDTLDRLLGRLDYRGVFSAEFKLDPRDGALKIIEVNPRPWWYVDFASRSGVDVCEMAYRDALGLAVARVPEYRVGARFAFPYWDVHVGRRLCERGELTLRSLFGSWLGASQPILSWDDPKPILSSLAHDLRQTLRRRFYR